MRKFSSVFPISANTSRGSAVIGGNAFVGGESSIVMMSGEKVGGGYGDGRGRLNP
jgi:hypothetical protein